MTDSTGSTTKRSGMVTGMFKDRESAERAFDLAGSRGYDKNDINVLMSDEARKKHFSSDHTHTKDTELGNKAMEDGGKGAAIGGTAGAILMAIAAAGTLAIPGLNVIFAGPLVAALAGAGAGGLTGGLIGALVGAGIPKERAEAYDVGVMQGNIVLGVTPRNDDDAAYFEREWKNNRGEQVYR